MPDISLNKNSSFANTQALAAWLNDPLLQERANELRALAKHGDNFAPTPEQALALDIKRAWVNSYGDDVTLWPQRLKNSLATMNAGVGFSNFSSNLTSAFQDLRLEDMTVRAFDAGMAVVAPFMGPDSPMNRATTNTFIPESAARAGLSFISSPFTLMVPMWTAGMMGRAVTGLTANAGRSLSLADSAIAGLATLFGLTGEAAGFVATSHVIASGFAHPELIVSLSNDEGWRSKDHGQFSSFDRLRMNETGNDILTEFAASTAFFASLRLFGWAGQTLGSILAVSETGIALAKLAQHASSITGLAFTEGIQEAAGIAPESGDDMWTRMVRATFLHGTMTSINGLVRLEPSGTPVTATAREIENSLRQFMDIRQPLFQTEGPGNKPLVLYPSFDKLRMNDSSDEPPRDGTIGPKAGEGPQGGIEETVRLLKEHGFDLPAQEYITQLLPKIGKFIGAINPEAWGETAASEFSKKLRAADHDVLKYVHEVVDTAGGTSFLLLLDRLGLVPNRIKLAIQLAINDAAQKEAEADTVNAAAYTIASSYQNKYGSLPDKGPIRAKLAQMPHELVRLLTNLTPFPDSHLKVAEWFDLLDPPR